MPPTLRRYIVEKGYLAVDGVSLTVAAASEERFEIALIPETSARTTLGTKTQDDRVNLEIDPDRAIRSERFFIRRSWCDGHSELTVVKFRL